MISDILSGEDEDERFTRIQDLVEERQVAQTELTTARQRRNEVERRVEELEDRAEETRREAKTQEILPSGESEGAAATALKSKKQEREEILAEKEQLDTEVDRAEERLNEVETELEEALAEVIPEVIARLEEHTKRHRLELRRFSEDVLNRLDDLREKAEERGELVEKLGYLMGQLEGEDRQTNFARRHEVRQRVKLGLDGRLRGEMLALQILDAFRGVTSEEDLEERPPRLTSDRVPLRTLD